MSQVREQIQRPCGWLRGSGETGAGKAVPRALASPERGAGGGPCVRVGWAGHRAVWTLDPPASFPGGL